MIKLQSKYRILKGLSFLPFLFFLAQSGVQASQLDSDNESVSNNLDNYNLNKINQVPENYKIPEEDNQFKEGVWSMKEDIYQKKSPETSGLLKKLLIGLFIVGVVGVVVFYFYDDASSSR